MVLSSPWAIVLIHRNHHSTASAIAGNITDKIWAPNSGAISSIYGKAH